MKNGLVRICKDCGTVYGASKKRCETCGTRLSEPMENKKAIGMSDDILEKKEETAQIIENSRAKARDGAELTARADEVIIPVGPARITAGIIACAAFIGAVINLALFFTRGGNIMDHMYPVFSQLLVLIPFAPYVILDSFAPNFVWALHHFGHSSYHRSIEPSDFYIDSSAAADVFLAIASLVCVLITLFTVII